MMRRYWFLPVLLLAAICITATPVAATTLQWAGGQYTNAYGGSGVGAYTFHINGDTTKTVLGLCDDAFQTMPSKNTPWEVVIHPITTDPQSLNNPPSPQARFFDDLAPDASLQKYQQGAWLASRMVSVLGNTQADNLLRTELQYAMWRLFRPTYGQSIFDADATKLAAVNGWIAKSLDAVVNKNFTGAGWSVFTPVYPCGTSQGCDPATLRGVPSQEIYIRTPEAYTTSLLSLNLFGLLGLAYYFRTKIS